MDCNLIHTSTTTLAVSSTTTTVLFACSRRANIGRCGVNISDLGGHFSRLYYLTMHLPYPPPFLTDVFPWYLVLLHTYMIVGIINLLA